MSVYGDKLAILLTILGNDLNDIRLKQTINKLIDANILSYAVTNKTGIKGKRQKVYMINPYVVRRSPVINEYLKTLFIDISEGLPSIELPVNKAKLLDQED